MIYYQNHLLDTFVLDGDGVAFCERGEVLDWAYTVRELNGMTSFAYMEPCEFTADVTIVGTSTETAKAAMDRLADCLAVDTGASEFGRFYVGDWYRSVLPIGVTHAYSMGDSEIVASIRLRSDEPMWTRAVVRELVPPDPSGLDFPHDYPHDLGTPTLTNSIINASPYPSPLIVSVQGPAASGWSVTAGTNVYRCNVALAAGETLTIDGGAKTIKLKRANGTVEDAFSTWAGTFKEGSGSYVFEPVPSGEVPVSWAGFGDGGVALTVLERRAEIGWSL